MRTRWPFRVVVMLAGAALCYGAAVLALAPVERKRHPDRALKLVPFDAQALAGSAFVAIASNQSPATLERAGAAARRALAREPINVTALRTLGLVAAARRNNSQAEASFRLVEKLSRRDLPTQIWWIEHEVARESVPGALKYFDEALRTSPRSSDILLPVLVNAMVEAEIAREVRPFLSSRPSYFRQFFIQATDTTPNINHVATLGMQLLDRQSADDRDLINRIILRFGRDKKFESAWRVFSWGNGGKPFGTLVNGDFESPNLFSLFHWNAPENDTLSAETSAREGSNVLYLVARGPRGVASRQLLRLAPGQYELSAQVGDVPDARIDRPSIDVECASGSKQALAPVAFPPSPNLASTLRAQFEVAPGCPFQWLNLRASSSTEEETRAWIDNIEIRQRKNR
ncbi:MAG TPA: hypothetical protein VL918_13105 [Sphingobium sp.]|nr:hypothetical protein [Sphingobium sp.]